MGNKVILGNKENRENRVIWVLVHPYTFIPLYLLYPYSPYTTFKIYPLSQEIGID